MGCWYVLASGGMTRRLTRGDLIVLVSLLALIALGYYFGLLKTPVAAG